jgi:hypothetical protein
VVRACQGSMLAVGPDRKGRKGWQYEGHGCAGPTRLGTSGEVLKKSHDFRPVLGTRIRYSAKTSRCLRCLVHTISVLVGG